MLTSSVTMVILFFETINKEILGETLGDFVLSRNQNLTLFQRESLGRIRSNFSVSLENENLKHSRRRLLK